MVSLQSVMRRIQDAIQAGPGTRMLSPWTLTWGLPPFRESSFRSRVWEPQSLLLGKAQTRYLSPLP